MTKETITTANNNQVNIYRARNDYYGNPRYIIHFLNIDNDYQTAVQNSRKIGGKIYRGKDFGGGIVFKSYNVRVDLDSLGL